METIHGSSFSGNHREPGTTRLSVSAVAELLGMRQQELAEFAGVHVETLRDHPESVRLQSVLRDLVRLISVATTVEPNLQRSVGLVKESAISAFGGKTLMQLVEVGRTDDAIAYLESVGSGYLG